MKYYFLESVNVKGESHPKLRLLHGQTTTGSTPLDSGLNVSGDRTVRSSYPVGTVFCTPQISQVANGGKQFYKAGVLKVVKATANINSSDICSFEALQQYNQFSGQNRNAGGNSMDAEALRKTLEKGVALVTENISGRFFQYHMTLNQEILDQLGERKPSGGAGGVLGFDLDMGQWRTVHGEHFVKAEAFS